MTARDFCFWMQGFVEMAPDAQLTAAQMAQVRTHLALVFKHDPAMEHEPPPAEPAKPIMSDTMEDMLKLALERADRAERPHRLYC